MISDEISHLIDERCKVALAAILTVKDREIDHRVPDDVSVELRRAVLREVNGFKEFVLEILASAQTQNLVLNQLWLDELSNRLDEIYDAGHERHGARLVPVMAAERQRLALIAQRATWGMRNDLKRAVRLHVYQTVLSMTDSVMAAVQEADARTAQQVRNVAEVFGRGLAPAESKRAHQEIGSKAQKSVLASYAQVVTAGGNSRGNRYPYRRQARQPNRRYAGGALRRALADKDFFEATADGLRFVNVTSLNRKARHWARLNAGAGPVGQGSRRRFQVRWSNLVVAAIGIEQAPRPAFFLPRGYWFSRGAGVVVSADSGRIGQDEFYPQGTGPFRGRRRLDGVNAGGYSGPGLARRRPSRGIRARNFLDAGMATIAMETPAAYERMYQRLWDQGVVGKGPQAKIQTNARPRAEPCSSPGRRRACGTSKSTRRPTTATPGPSPRSPRRRSRSCGPTARSTAQRVPRCSGTASTATSHTATGGPAFMRSDR